MRNKSKLGFFVEEFDVGKGITS